MFTLYFTDENNNVHRDFGPYTNINIPTLILLEFQEKNDNALHGYIRNDETKHICFTFWIFACLKRKQTKMNVQLS